MYTTNQNKGLYINPGGQQKCEYEGRIYQSQKYGKYKVLRELIGIGMKSRIFEVEFLDTGYHAIVTRGKMISGEIKDKYVPSVLGIGYLGDEYYITDPNKRMYYKIWSDMLYRCYSPNCDDYYSYGAIGVTVDPRWYNFTTFYFDIRNIPGFWNKVSEPKMYNLDKDYLQQHLPQSMRVYSKDTCLWISTYENMMLKGKDNSKSGYFGVYESSDCRYYYTEIYGINYSKFINVKDAACLFNYIFPLVKNPYCTLPMLNNVPMVPFEELIERNVYGRNDILISIYNNNKEYLDHMYNTYNPNS